MNEHANVDHEAIRRRAFEISAGPDAGTPEENWLRAEEELRHPSPAEDATRHEELEEAHAEEQTAELQAHVSALTHP